MSPFDDKRLILEGGMKTLPFGHAEAIEATVLEVDPEWDAPTQDENEDLFGEKSENDNESDRILLASTENSHPIPVSTE